MNYIIFKELEEIAKAKGITGSKVKIGKWAKDNGYIKKIKLINKIRTVIYIKPN